MSSFKCNSNNAPDALQLNMENISKELNELIVTGEQEFGMTQKYKMTTVNNTTVAHSLMTIPVLPVNFKAPTYIANGFYGQQQQNIKHNLNFSTLQPPAPLGCVNSTLNNFATNTACYTPQNLLCTGKYFSHSTLRPTQAPYVSAAASPTYEFHFLRNPDGNENKFSTSNVYKGGHGAFRKITKLTQKNFHQRIPSSAAENKEIMIDLSVLDYFNIE